MVLIDTHAHLYDSIFADTPVIMEAFRKVGGAYILMPNIDVETLPLMCDCRAQYPTQTFMMLGLHPAYVKEDYAEHLEKLYDFYAKYPFIAIGEIGLDRFMTTPYKKQQEESFHKQIEWALKHQLPIVIHARDSLNACISIVKEYKNMNLKGVFHCYAGDYNTAKLIVDMGFYLGIGGIVTFKNATQLAETVEKIPLRHILLETDAPYLAPAPYRGKRNESAFLEYIALKIATLKNTTSEEVGRQTALNACQLFKLPLPDNLL